MKLIAIDKSLSLTKVCSILTILTLVGCGGSSGGGKKSSSSVSTASSVSSSVVSSSSSSGWTLVWSDEFDGEAINTDDWEHEVNCWGGGNNELQCYTDEPENSFVSEGALHIVAIREASDYCGPRVNQDDPAYDPNDTSSCKPYTSARLRTKGKQDWTYGRMEVRAKTPFGKGLWPAIWMLPTDYEYGGWPHSGEIDIFEAFSPGTDDFGDLNEIAGTLHYGFSWPWNQYTGKDSAGATYTPETNIWEEFHTYAVEWEEGEIRWYVDGHHYGTQRSNAWFSYYWGGQQSGYTNAVGAQPFDKAFHMLLNVAVGGVPGTPPQDATFPQTLEVEFVRVYECSVNPETGKGCATVNPGVTPVSGHTSPPDAREEVYLYQGGAQTLTFDVEGEEINNTLVPGFYDNNTGVVISNPAFDAGDDGIVWDIDFNGAGSAFLTSGDMSSVAAVETGFDFGDGTNGRAKNIGEFKFDMKVLDRDPETKFRIKLDSGWPNLSYHEIQTPATGEWEEVSVRFYSLRDNDGQGSVDYRKIMNAFVIEPVDGTAHIQLNNIRISCLQSGGGCDIKPVLPSATLEESFDVFINAVDPLWNSGIGMYQTAGGHITQTVVNAAESERGQVIDIMFNNAGASGLVFIQTSAPKNVTAFAANGYITFDVKVLDYGTNTTGLAMKVDCVFPCTSNDRAIGIVGDGEWETVTVPVSELVTSGLDLTKVDTPIVIFPTWDQPQQGLHLQVDNIRWVLPE